MERRLYNVWWKVDALIRAISNGIIVRYEILRARLLPAVIERANHLIVHGNHSGEPASGAEKGIMKKSEGLFHSSSRRSWHIAYPMASLTTRKQDVGNYAHTRLPTITNVDRWKSTFYRQTIHGRVHAKRKKKVDAGCDQERKRKRKKNCPSVSYLSAVPLSIFYYFDKFGCWKHYIENKLWKMKKNTISSIPIWNCTIETFR